MVALVVELAKGGRARVRASGRVRRTAMAE